jgi:FkbM family methyltransferase
MKQFVKALKLFALRLLNRLGYTIVKLPPQGSKSSKMSTVMVGGKAIKIPQGSPLCHYYQTQPRMNYSLGTIAAMIQDRFPAAWAMDVGANVGDTLAVIKGQASLPVICVEGDGICFEILQENARLFDLVFLHQTFLAEKLGEAEMDAQKVGWNQTLVPARSGTPAQKFLFDTVDHLISGMSQRVVVKLLKVDTEGHDLRIIRGAEEVLKRDKPVLSFELNRENLEPLGDSVGDFFDFLVSLGYRRFLLSDSFGRLICFLCPNTKDMLLDLYR